VNDPSGRASAHAWEFERFIRELLLQQAYIVNEEINQDMIGDFGVDFVAHQVEQRPLLVEAKATTPQTDVRLKGAIAQLQTASMRYQKAYKTSAKPRLALAFPGAISPRKQMPVRAAEVQLWDGGFLQQEALRLGVPAPRFLAATEKEAAAERLPADDLNQGLAHIAAGHPDWPRFEKFCEDLLNVLFCPPLNQVISQSSNESGVNRRDFILPNYAPDGFWSFMRLHYRADFIVADAKNYTSPVSKEEILGLSNYLSHHGTGLFGLLLTRHGLKRDAKWTCKEQWLLHDKMIIGLDDEDYRQMLLTKRTGGDPSDLVRQRIEDFRLRI
jgi:hypothetical protein